MAGVMIARLEAMLLDAARERRMMTYREVARGLEIKPPHTIHKAALLIEALMRCHAEDGAPQLASLVISRVRGGLPAPGYFLLLRELNLFDGDGEGEVARTYHENEVHRCFDANG